MSNVARKRESVGHFDLHHLWQVAVCLDAKIGRFKVRRRRRRVVVPGNARAKRVDHLRTDQIGAADRWSEVVSGSPVGCSQDVLVGEFVWAWIRSAKPNNTPKQGMLVA